MGSIHLADTRSTRVVCPCDDVEHDADDGTKQLFQADVDEEDTPTPLLASDHHVHAPVFFIFGGIAATTAFIQSQRLAEDPRTSLTQYKVHVTTIQHFSLNFQLRIHPTLVRHIL